MLHAQLLTFYLFTSKEIVLTVYVFCAYFLYILCVRDDSQILWRYGFPVLGCHLQTIKVEIVTSWAALSDDAL